MTGGGRSDSEDFAEFIFLVELGFGVLLMLMFESRINFDVVCSPLNMFSIDSAKHSSNQECVGK